MPLTRTVVSRARFSATRKRAATAFCAIVGVLAVLVSPAEAASPTVLASVEGTCNGGQYGAGAITLTSPPASASSENVVYRFTGLSGAATATYAYYTSISTGDQVLTTSGDVAAGSTRSASFTCYQVNKSVSIRFEILAADAPGLTFSGTSAGQSNYVTYIAPWSAAYDASIGVTSGSVHVSDRDFSSPGIASLGDQTSGSHDPAVGTLEGPQANWSVTVSPRPIALSAVSVRTDGDYTAKSTVTVTSGTSLQFGYTVSSDASMNVAVFAADGRAVRSLGSGLQRCAGQPQ